MSGLNPLESILKGLSNALPEPVKNMQHDFENSAKQALENTLHKMNLVTREEFEIQNAVLQRTRSKLETLEKQVAELELLLKQRAAIQPLNNEISTTS